MLTLLLVSLMGLASCASDPAMTAPSEVIAPVTFRLTSSIAADGGVLPTEFTCDGVGVSPPLQWSGAPAGTREFALVMTTLPGDGTTKWNWVLYGIPAATTGLPRASTGIGTQGYGSDGPAPGYQPPCSQGPGAKAYTFTVAALSGTPSLPTARITGSLLATAIAPVTLATASMTLTYTRPSAALQEIP